MKVTVFIAAHKPYRFAEDPMYLPLQVGCALHESFGIVGDNTGDNISEKNANYCELTGLYWAWKNLEADYVGLCHYRRYFAGSDFGDKWDRVLTEKQAEELLQDTDVILPKKRNYYIETNYGQYIHAHHKEDLDTTREIIEEMFPDYLEAFDEHMSERKTHIFNMFIMRKDIMDSYCQWLFALLSELEKRLDISEYSVNDKRVFGFVSERMLDVWLNANGISYKELPVVSMEKQNWIVKGSRFVMRKMGIKK